MAGSNQLAAHVDVSAVLPGAAHVVVAPPFAHHIAVDHDCSASDASNNTSFVKAIDRKARGYLKTLERSLSFSAPSILKSGEDPSSTTIEFLRARLQAQRAEYKAEKQRAQQLAKKVLEVEQRLKLEVERRKKMANPTPISDINTCAASSSGECSRSGERFIGRKETTVYLPNTIPRQCSTSQMKRIMYSKSFPDMNPSCCEHYIAESSSARRHIIHRSSLSRPHTYEASTTSSSGYIDEHNESITDCSTGKDAQATTKTRFRSS